MDHHNSSLQYLRHRIRSERYVEQIGCRRTMLNLKTATVPFVFIFYFFYDIAYTPMLIAYTLEILPFNIRAKGFAVMVGFGIRLFEALSDA